MADFDQIRALLKAKKDKEQENPNLSDSTFSSLSNVQQQFRLPGEDIQKEVNRSFDPQLYERYVEKQHWGDAPVAEKRAEIESEKQYKPESEIEPGIDPSFGPEDLLQPEMLSGAAVKAGALSKLANTALGQRGSISMKRKGYGPEAIKAMRQKVEGMTGAMTREEAFRHLKNTRPWEKMDLIDKKRPETIINYLNQYVDRSSVNPEAKSFIKEYLREAGEYEKGRFPGAEIDPHVYNMFTEADPDMMPSTLRNQHIIGDVEYLADQKLPLSISQNYPRIRETTPPQANPDINPDLFDYEITKIARGGGAYGDQYMVVPKEKGSGANLGEFRFEVKNGMIQPQGSYKYDRLGGEDGTEPNPYKDVASRVYKKIEDMVGGKIIPDQTQTQGGRKLHLEHGFGRDFGIPVEEIQPSKYPSSEGLHHLNEEVRETGDEFRHTRKLLEEAKAKKAKR